MEISENYVKLYLGSYGYKDKVNYAGFLNLVYPIDVELLKYIAVTGIKKYAHQSKLTEEVIYIFMMLVKEEVNLLEELDELKT